MKRYIVVCEGPSERVYLQRLQSFIDSQSDVFNVPLQFIPHVPRNSRGEESGGGSYRNISSCYRSQRRDNRRSNIEVWVDHDLYFRNDQGVRDQYLNRPGGIPAFRFSYHNFEDFLVMHNDDATVREWHSLFLSTGHITTPLHSRHYMLHYKTIFPGYTKGDLSPDFISRKSLILLKRNSVSPIIAPCIDPEFTSFATFLIGEIESVFPDLLI